MRVLRGGQTDVPPELQDVGLRAASTSEARSMELLWFPGRPRAAQPNISPAAGLKIAMF